MKMLPGVSILGLGLWPGMTLLLGALYACMVRTVEHNVETNATTPIRLDFVDDGKQIKLLVQHAEIGPVCELHCYEGGPFQYGTATKREDGSVVFVHTAGKMTATTTFAARGEDRVSMDVRIEGPLEELKQVNYVGPCMQFWHSEAFKQRETLAEFARRCFLYTLRGPVGMLETARGAMSSFKPDAPENNPPCTQWYVPLGKAHPGNIWGFGASGDRPVYGVVAVASRDGRWLAAIGCASTNTLGQGWHDCIHHVPQLPAYLDQRAGRILHRSMLYVLPNDRNRLLRSYRQDFSGEIVRPGVSVSAGKNETLQVRPRPREVPGLDLSLGIRGAERLRTGRRGAAWKVSPWGGFVRGDATWRMWAYPSGDAVDLCVSVAGGARSDRIEAALGGPGWTPERAPEDVPALVRRSPDGAWIAALIWERNETGKPASGVPEPGEENAASRSVRGRLFLYRGEIEKLREQWIKAEEEWRHSVPYRMPVAEPPGRTPKEVGP